MSFLDQVNSFNFLGKKAIQEADSTSGADSELLNKVITLLSEVTGDPAQADEHNKNQIFNYIRFILENVTEDLMQRAKSDKSFQKILLMLLEDDKVKWIKEYLKHTGSVIVKNKEVNSPEDFVKKIENGEVPEGFGEDLSLTAFRLNNLKEIFSNKKEDSKIADDLINQINKELSEEKEYLTDLTKTINNYINGGEQSQLDDRISKLTDSQNKMYDLFSQFIDSQIENKKKDKESDIKRDSSSGIKKERFNKIKNILNAASLPSVTQGKIEADGNGEFYLLFKKLQTKYPKLAEDLLKNSVYSGNNDKYTDFLQKANDEEGIEEGFQMDYLKFCTEWMKKYVKDDTLDGKFSEKDRDNYSKEIERIYEDRARYIKNIYLSKGFNLGNFISIELKPEIKLPLYQKVKLAVTDKDRKAESAKGQLISGLKGIGGIFMAGAETGNIASAQNKAIFNALTSLVGAGVTVIGGKEAARKYNKGIESFSKTGVAKDLSLTKNSEKVKEQETVGSNFPSIGTQSSSSPGVSMQVPQQMITDIDNMALVGPGAPKKKEKKKKVKKPEFSPLLNAGKIMKFDQFIKSR